MNEINKRNNKYIMCSFASPALWRSLQRISKQAEMMDVYNSIVLMSKNDLNSEFLKKYSTTMERTKGYGFWCWKPQVIKQVLDTCSEGDIVHYIDAGCWLNPIGKIRLFEYFQMCEASESGFLAFQAPMNMPHGLEWFSLPEYRWTKRALLDHFSIGIDNAASLENQIEATTFFIRKDKATVAIIDEWINVYNENFSLIDDSTSVIGEFDGFVEHRYDQSIFSLLMKHEGCTRVSSLEIYHPVKLTGQDSRIRWSGSWDELKNFPILAKRDKDFGVLIQIWNIAQKILNKVKKRIMRI